MSGLRSGVVGDPGPLDVLPDQGPQGRPARPASGTDVAGQRLDLLNVDVRVEDQVSEVVGGIPDAEPGGSPVVRQADLVHPAALPFDGPDPAGDQAARLDRGTGRDDGGPARVHQAPLGGQFGGYLT